MSQSPNQSPLGRCAPQDMDKAQFDKLFATTFVPRSAQAAAKPTTTATTPTGPQPVEHYEELEAGEEAAVTDAAEVLDAVADWEENTLPDSSAVCTFWTRGECRVVGCPFLHQFYGVRCQHLPHCILGAGCPFVHTTVADQRRRWAALGAELVPPPMDEDPDSAAPAPRAPQKPPRKADFPTLGATSVPVPVSSAKQKKKKEKEVEEEEMLRDEPDPDDPELGADVHVETAAERLSLQELKRLFHWVPAAVVETIFVQWFVLFLHLTLHCFLVIELELIIIVVTLNTNTHNNPQQYSGRKMEGARKFLRTAYPEPAERPRPVVLGPVAGAGRTIDAVCERERDFATDIGRADDPNREWRRVTTAERQVTAELRTEAFMHAKMRNMHFRLATQAFIAGNGAVAKRHSELGKEHDRMMRNLNSSAAQQLIRIRNPHFCSFRGTNENVLDLHGLTVREGIDFLRGIFVNTKCTHGLFPFPFLFVLSFFFFCCSSLYHHTHLCHHTNTTNINRPHVLCDLWFWAPQQGAQDAARRRRAAVLPRLRLPLLGLQCRPARWHAPCACATQRLIVFIFPSSLSSCFILNLISFPSISQLNTKRLTEGASQQ